MSKLQQSAACPICLVGLQNGTDTDDYLENLNHWQEHLLELEEHTEPWLSWHKKEPIVTHKVDGSDKVHWLCRECVYRHNPDTGQFAVETCPICQHDVNIPGRNADNLEEYAHRVIADEVFSIENQDGSEDE